MSTGRLMPGVVQRSKQNKKLKTNHRCLHFLRREIAGDYGSQ